MMRFETFSILGGAPAIPLSELDEVCTLVNADSTNFLTIGHFQEVQPGDQASVLFGPGQTMSVDGSTEVWVVNPTGNPAVSVLKLPGTTQLSSTGLAPTGTPPIISSVNSVGASASRQVIPKGTGMAYTFPVQLLACSISSVCTGQGPATFEDAFVDTLGVSYFTVENGLSSAAGGVAISNLAQELKNAVLPAGRLMFLQNGGGGASLSHQIAGTIVFYPVNI